MKEIVERLHESRQIELAKSILESNGYKIEKRGKRLKEASRTSLSGSEAEDYLKELTNEPHNWDSWRYYRGSAMNGNTGSYGIESDNLSIFLTGSAKGDVYVRYTTDGVVGSFFLKGDFSRAKKYLYTNFSIPMDEKPMIKSSQIPVGFKKSKYRGIYSSEFSVPNSESDSNIELILHLYPSYDDRLASISIYVDNEEFIRKDYQDTEKFLQDAEDCYDILKDAQENRTNWSDINISI